jgi:hypothetical protein
MTHFHNQQYPEKKSDQSKITTTKPHTLKYDKKEKWRHQHQNKKIHLKALKFPAKRLLLGMRYRALLSI